MEANNSDNFFYLLIAFFSLYIILQIYIVFKMRLIIQKIFEIIFRIDGIFRQVKMTSLQSKITPLKVCKNCQNRIPFYYSENEKDGFFYYRCRLTKKQVPGDHACDNFILDPQTYDV